MPLRERSCSRSAERQLLPFRECRKLRAAQHGLERWLNDGAPQIYGKKKRKKLLGRKTEIAIFSRSYAGLRILGGLGGLEEVDFVRFLFGFCSVKSRTEHLQKQAEPNFLPNRTAKKNAEPNRRRTEQKGLKKPPNRTEPKVRSTSTPTSQPYPRHPPTQKSPPLRALSRPKFTP